MFLIVNGTSGEGMCLNVAERKKTAEEWQRACTKYQISHMLQIGGAPMVDVIELVSALSLVFHFRQTSLVFIIF